MPRVISFYSLICQQADGLAESVARSAPCAVSATKAIVNTRKSCPHLSAPGHSPVAQGEVPMAGTIRRRGRIRSWHAEPDRIAAMALGQAGMLVGLVPVEGQDLVRLRRLEGQLRRERARGRAACASYDLRRHAALLRAIALLRHGTGHKKAPPGGPDGAAVDAGTGFSGPCGGAADPDPSAWRAASARRHNSAPPSGSRPAGPTSRGNLRATGCTGCAGGASAT